MTQYLLAVAAAFAGSSVALGAFGSHGLRGKLSEPMLNAFQTGVQYQMYPSLALLLLVLWYRQTGHTSMLWSFGFISAGIVLFSGSLYLLAITGSRIFGPITPVGGVCFLLGWGWLCYGCLRNSS